MSESGITEKKISRFHQGLEESGSDFLAVEEPLEISILVPGNTPQKVSVTMRTPGNDKELASGFLFTEGILNSLDQIEKVYHTQSLPGVESNTITVELKKDVHFDLSKLQRNFYTTSSCGVCGKASIDAIKTVGVFGPPKSVLNIEKDLILSLPEKLRNAQETFEKTGGLHASAIFDTNGNLIALREDVGRHNALDKLIGYAFLNGQLPLEQHILLLSGRASFELLQKAAMAGIQFVSAIGAPSSLAVETANDFGITLIGFLSASRFNVYAGSERII
jgi:FdhD protein